MSDWEVFLYETNIPRISALREIRERTSSVELDGDGWYKLWMLATEDPVQASKAKATFELSRMIHEQEKNSK